MEPKLISDSVEKEISYAEFLPDKLKQGFLNSFKLSSSSVSNKKMIKPHKIRSKHSKLADIPDLVHSVRRRFE